MHKTSIPFFLSFTFLLLPWFAGLAVGQSGKGGCGREVTNKSKAEPFELVLYEADRGRRHGILERLLRIDEKTEAGVGKEKVLELVRTQLELVVLADSRSRILVAKDKMGIDVGYLAYINVGHTARVHRLSVSGARTHRTRIENRLMGALLEEVKSGELAACEFDFNFPVLTSDVSKFIARHRLQHLGQQETWEPNIWRRSGLECRLVNQSGEVSHLNAVAIEDRSDKGDNPSRFFAQFLNRFPGHLMDYTVAAYEQAFPNNEMVGTFRSRLATPRSFLLLRSGFDVVSVAVGRPLRNDRRLVVTDIVNLGAVANEPENVTALLRRLLHYADENALNLEIHLQGHHARIADSIEGLNREPQEAKQVQNYLFETFRYTP